MPHKIILACKCEIRTAATSACSLAITDVSVLDVSPVIFVNRSNIQPILSFFSIHICENKIGRTRTSILVITNGHTEYLQTESYQTANAILVVGIASGVCTEKVWILFIE